MGSSGVTSDCGWGCMLRSGQMMMAQALVLHWLGRDWRLTSASGLDLNPTERWQSERLYRAIISVFSDSADTRAAPLSLHTMVRLGRGAGKGPGDWYGPHTVAHLLVSPVILTSIINMAIVCYRLRQQDLLSGDLGLGCNRPQQCELVVFHTGLPDG